MQPLHFIGSETLGNLPWRHMCFRRTACTLCISVALTLMLATLLVASASAQQVPPPINLRTVARGDEVNPPPTVGSGIKFYAFVGRGSRSEFDVIAGNPDFAGVKKAYDWRDIEPAENVYDFSEIEGDLAYVGKMGKKLWIYLRFVQFNGNYSPYTPSYMWNNPKYGGDSRYYGSYPRFVTQGWYPIWWNTYVKQKLIALYNAVGSRFTNSPYLEGITLDETSVEVGKEYGGTATNILETFQQNAMACRVAFPNKIVIQQINFTPGYDLPSFARWCVDNHIGLGCPDMVLDGKQAHYLLLLQYHDYVPTGPCVEWPNYDEINPATGAYCTAQELLAGAIAMTNPQYMFWETRSPYFTRDVIPAVRAYMQSVK